MNRPAYIPDKEPYTQEYRVALLHTGSQLVYCHFPSGTGTPQQVERNNAPAANYPHLWRIIP